jgi:hypothetical protein
MAHEVTLPSGEVVEFPDEMPDDAIAQALKGYSTAPAGAAAAAQPQPAPDPNIPGYLPPGGAAPGAVIPPPELPGGRLGPVGGSAAIKGLAEGVGLPGDLAALALPAPIAERLPTSTAIEAPLRRWGLIDTPASQPRDFGERILAGAGESIGSALPYALAGPAGELAAGAGGARAAGSLAKTLAQTATEAGGAGAGSAVGQEYWPGAGGPVGALAGLIAGGGVRGVLGRGVSAAAGAEAAVPAAMGRLGMTPRLAGDVTGSDILKGVQSTALRAPGGGLAQEALQKTLTEFGNAADSAAGRMGAPVSLEDAGTALQDRARQWYGQWKGDQAAAWNALDQKVPDTTPVSMTGVNQTLGRLGGRGGGATPQISAIMGDPVAQNLQTALSADLPSTVPGFDNLPWQSVKNWRSQVGERLEQSLLANSADQTDWRALYGGLSDAMKGAAQNQGAADEFANAAGVTARGHLFHDNVVSGVIDHPDPARNTIPAAGAANFALSGSNIGGAQGGQRLQAIRDTMGDAAADELAAFKLRSMASAKPFGQSAAGDAASPTSFLTAWNTLSPGAKDALYGDPARRGEINDLLTVAGSMKDTATRFGNPSGTAGAGLHAGTLASILAAPEAIGAGYYAGGIPGAAAGAATASIPMLIGPTAANLTARPALTRALAQPSLAPSVIPRWLTRLGAAAPQLSNVLAGETPR